MKALTITTYQWKDLFRDKWLIAYALIYLVLNDALIRFGGGGPKALLSLSNIILLFVPLISMIYGVLYMYQSREFVELLLSQPIERRSLFAGLYSGLAMPLCVAFLVGSGAPFLYTGIWMTISPDMILMVFGIGMALTLIFVGLGFLFALKYFDKKIKGFGLAIMSWLILAVLYDGLILLIVNIFSDYPLEKAMLGMSMINPIDLARIGVLLKFDISALMGYTGAIFNRFFGSTLGLWISLVSLVMWISIPAWRSFKTFINKDF